MNNYIKFIVYSSLTIVILFFGFDSYNKYKDSKQIKVNIYSTLDNERNNTLEKKINKQFPEYKLEIVNLGDDEITSMLEYQEKSTIQIILGVDEINAKKISSKLLQTDYSNIEYNKENIEKSYGICTKTSNTFIVNKKVLEMHNKKIPTTIKDLTKEEYKNEIAMMGVKTNAQTYSIIDYVYNNYDQKEANEIIKKIYKNVGEVSTTIDGCINNLNKEYKAITYLPLNIAQKTCSENPNIELLKLEEKLPYYNEVLAITKDGAKKEETMKVFEYIKNNIESINAEKNEQEKNIVNIAKPNVDLYKLKTERLKKYYGG